MTNAIEQAKREMCDALENMKGRLKINYSVKDMIRGAQNFEDQLESYLELLRQDHEALHETARARFEDIGKLEAASQELAEGLRLANENVAACAKHSAGSIADLESRLAKMTEERDSIQLRLHAVDHAYKTQQDRMAIPVKDSGDRGSCEATEANAGVIRAAVRSIQLVITDWGMGDLKAKKAMRQIARIVNGDGTVGAACGALEKGDTCMHSFFAIGDDQMKCTFCGVGK